MDPWTLLTTGIVGAAQGAISAEAQAVKPLVDAAAGPRHHHHKKPPEEAPAVAEPPAAPVHASSHRIGAALRLMHRDEGGFPHWKIAAAIGGTIAAGGLAFYLYKRKH
jgi:hypothetical protein